MTSGINDTGEITRDPGTETAVLAGGCFWGLEDLIRRQPGVVDTRVGYTGGDNDHATYRNHPGHAEAVEDHGSSGCEEARRLPRPRRRRYSRAP